jgi:hypothetical protein
MGLQRVAHCSTDKLPLFTCTVALRGPFTWRHRLYVIWGPRLIGKNFRNTIRYYATILVLIPDMFLWGNTLQLGVLRTHFLLC